MDFLDAYASDDEKLQLLVPEIRSISAVVSAPVVLKGGTRFLKNESHLVSLQDCNIRLGIEGITARNQGPSHPFKQKLTSSATGNPGSGQFESVFLEDWAFEQQFKDFQRSGFAVDAASNSFIGEKCHQQEEVAVNSNVIGRKRKKLESMSAVIDGDNDEVETDSPWILESKGEGNISVIVSQEVLEQNSASISSDKKLSSETNVHIVEPDEETEKWERVAEKKLGFVMPPRQQRGSEIAETYTSFHGQELFDYQGRSWVTPPPGIRPETDEHECFIPKKCIKKYTGHSKGVNDIHFFPFTGHLLLSSANDGKCKIWDVYRDRGVRRTYSGHSEGVRCTQFSDNGINFLSSGFDRAIRLWDVETGQAKGSFTNRKMGYDVKFRPGDNNIFLMAASDNKIYQWDVRTGEVCQEYNYHLQPCNTVTFFDRGRKFVSTSDDKKILVWEFDIPVPIKYLADPDMHSVPAVTVHPSGEYLAGQSMDNTIVVYSCGDKVKHIKKKTFTGHNNAGYACRIGFSPNGKLLISGDGHGKLHVWDWKSTKVILFSLIGYYTIH
jgi:pre-mRNA-processing factor 17